MKKITILIWLTIATLIPCSLLAFEIGKVQINGFISQGYMQSEDNNFLDPSSKDGTFEINEVGLTFNVPVTEKLRIGTQFLSRDLGPDGNNEVTLDWASGDYRFKDWLGIRIGKLKLPIGLYNETRDSDILRSMAFLPQSIYDEMQRSFMSAGYGGAIYGNIPGAAIGDFDYQIFYGQVQVNEDNFLVDVGLKDGGIGAITDGMTGGLASISKFDYEADRAFAASLIYNTPLDGLRFGASYFKSEGKFDVDLNTDLLALAEAGGAVPPGTTAGINSLDFDITANLEPMYVLSAEYSNPLFTISAEYMEKDNGVRAEGLLPVIGPSANFLPDTSMGWYVLGTIQVPMVPGLSLSAQYDEFYLDKDDKSETNPNRYRKDFGIGTRYDITPNWLVKAEWHTIDGTGLNMDIVNPDGLEDEWSYFIIKTTFNF